MVRHNFLVAITVTILLCLIPTIVNAGHPSWEPRPSEFKLNWVHLKPSDGLGPWPDKKIPYCYETARARNVLEPYIRQGMNLWYGAGLPQDFQMKEISRLDCLANRAYSLEIRLPEQIVFQTTVGRSTPAGDKGPSMLLGVRPELYMPFMYTVTHEIGHAWGLYHEHQDPAFWGSNGGVFNFYCENLADFEAKSAGLSSEEIWGDNGICEYLWAAAAREFSGLNFVPLPASSVTTWNSPNSEDHDVDWKSIMLYPSGTFAIDRGRTGKYSYTRKEGPPYIQQNNVPSTWDVGSLKLLYSARESSPITLYNQPQSSYHVLFVSMVHECRRRRR